MKFIKADKPITTNHKKHGEISLEVEVPQIESMEEFVSLCGGNDGAIEFVNNAIETASKNGGRAALRNAADDANLDELKTRVLGIVKDYTPQTGGDKAPSKAKKAAAFDDVKALVESGQEFTKEQLLELLSKAK
jgi:hypothetical protein